MVLYLYDYGPGIVNITLKCGLRNISNQIFNPKLTLSLSDLQIQPWIDWEQDRMVIKRMPSKFEGRIFYNTQISDRIILYYLRFHAFRFIEYRDFKDIKDNDMIIEFYDFIVIKSSKTNS